MKKVGSVLVMLFVLISEMYSQWDTTNNWLLEKNENGIKIYTRCVKGSEIKEFMAITKVDISIDMISDLVNNLDTYSKWMANTKKNYTLKRVDENTRYDYFEAEIPWPMRNRDNVLLVTKTQQPHNGQIVMNLKSVPDYIPEKPGLVRMPKADGLWQFTPVNDNEVEIMYRFIGDPGGYIPTWVVNLFLIDGPYKTLINLKEFASTLNKEVPNKDVVLD